MEFHISKTARDHYGFDARIYSLCGNVVLPDFQAARELANKLNSRRKPEQMVRAGQVNALGLIDELLHALVAAYRNEQPKVLERALASVQASCGVAEVEQTLSVFVSEFPAVAVYQGQQSVPSYLAGHSVEDDLPNMQVTLEEMLLLHLANLNPAFAPFGELFHDLNLHKTTSYACISEYLELFFEREPGFELAGGISLWQALRAPALAHPDSLEDQLRFLVERFGVTLERLSDGLRLRFGTRRDLRRATLGALDFLKEENRLPWRGGGTPAPTAVGVPRRRADLEHEPENFTTDREWMPRLVLIAKNAFVWLDQLSKKHQRPMRTLADVPDSELELLQSRGITGLWLIGLWERSDASKEIKQRMGNPDAVASAYSLYDYEIAHDLGGEVACWALQERAWRYGIRVASDMVPNHTGIDGRWVFEHPDWFLQLPHSPYPSHRFNGPNLSGHDGVALHLEDGYYNHSDAAVVFKWQNTHTLETRFIYHGNDGTGLPWNDTAQLDYLNPVVREAVIQTILRVAKQFPVIRFDAAMTLAKRHIQRLWHPEPGAGGAIPTRAEHAMTAEELDALMPEEFWREVVERCAQEAPDTLLLAEAFWMMEGYFVRSLGMHRVYNSAFMNMLRDEKNAEYRKILHDTLEFEPEILKRFVNFLSNPDEKTAVEQFGKHDKYFGAMTLCATLPGLPMLGHGQVEGYAEKYGMEYQRAYHDETPDEGFVAYHGTQIFPLLKRRALFADVEQFVMYNLETAHGAAEHVYAYSNAQGGERALVVYNNSNHAVSGHVRLGVAGKAQSRHLADALGVSGHAFVKYRNLVSGLEHLRFSHEFQGGLWLELGPYARVVMLDVEAMHDHDGRLVRLATRLGGAGVPSIAALLAEEDAAKVELDAGIGSIGTLVVKPKKASAKKTPTKKVSTKKTPAKTPASAKTTSKQPPSKPQSSGKAAAKASVKEVAAKKPTTTKPTAKKTSVGTSQKPSKTPPSKITKAKAAPSPKAAGVVKKVASDKKPTTAPNAKPSKPNPKKPGLKKSGNDLTLVWGIGPKYAAALVAAKITTFAALGKISTTRLGNILEKAGLRPASSQETWAAQAALLAANDEKGFARLVKKLQAKR